MLSSNSQNDASLPDGVYRNQIDYIIVKGMWRSSAKSSKTWPSADCGTDHELFVWMVKVKVRKKKATQFPWYDLEYTPTIFKENQRNHFKANFIDREPDGLRNELKGWMWKEAAKNEYREKSKLHVRENRENSQEEKPKIKKKKKGQKSQKGI